MGADVKAHEALPRKQVPIRYHFSDQIRHASDRCRRQPASSPRILERQNMIRTKRLRLSPARGELILNAVVRTELRWQDDKTKRDIHSG